MLELSYRISCPDQFLNQAKYFFALLAATAGIRLIPQNENPDIIYGQNATARSLFIPWQPVDPNTKWHILSIENISLRLPESVKGQLFDSATAHFEFDLISTMGAFLQTKLAANNSATAACEGVSDSEFNRFVNLFVYSLKKCGKIPADYNPKSLWPDNKSFALGLSYDIDILKRKITGSIIMLASALASGKYDKGVAGAWHGLLESAGSQLIGKRNPYCHFERYFGNELQSTTFIFAGNRLDKRDPTYNLDSISAELAPYLDKTEIALHNGTGTWDKEDILRANRNKIADRFGKAVAGIRPHYLDCKLPEFWSHLTEFEYSSSLGSDLRPGFVAGINTPLFGFTLPGWKQLDIIELPISLMDCALLAISDKQKRYRFVDDIIATCVSNHGILVLDWHNTSAYDNDFPGWFETYEYLINAALQNNAYIGGLGDIAKIWRTHCESVFSY